ncbi:MAG: TIGR03862 family flavoprotein [Actinobacteria bacterium]|nr:TIGR03862 family flavoprotein [Actinomycetota bacterium]MSZ04254.1 TIGR03862 family flavoprotein [Actinomycetota bacterium]MTB06297.1 TIGR03862 family flavoprotein [Actinomycetota bacterium]
MPESAQPNLRARVIGGGPAGLMAAEVLANLGADVAVFDHMPSMGRKLLLAGRSGLNLTHSEGIEDLLDRYGPARSRLEAAVHSFGPDALRAWSESLGEDTYIGTSGRVFPDSWRATPLLRAWLVRLVGLGVRLEPRHRWSGWADTAPSASSSQTLRFFRANGTVHEEEADITVLALGGASWPRVGSDGGWVTILRGVGVRVQDLQPSNVGVETGWSPHFVGRFEGTPLKNIAITRGGRTVRGDAMVTVSGLEGLPVYSHSSAVRDEVARNGRSLLAVDLHPDLAVDEVARRLGRRRPKDSLSNWLRRSLGLSPVAIGLLRECCGNELPGTPEALARLVKHAEIVVVGTTGIERAISSAGGVTLDEVDDRFMLRRLPGTFVAGEMLDWEAPTGGYLLQATFSTAVAAARGALQWAKISGGGAPE